jgi:hypothetical protein
MHQDDDYGLLGPPPAFPPPLVRQGQQMPQELNIMHQDDDYGLLGPPPAFPPPLVRQGQQMPQELNIMPQEDEPPLPTYYSPRPRVMPNDSQEFNLAFDMLTSQLIQDRFHLNARMDESEHSFFLSIKEAFDVLQTKSMFIKTAEIVVIYSIVACIAVAFLM